MHLQLLCLKQIIQTTLKHPVTITHLNYTSVLHGWCIFQNIWPSALDNWKGCPQPLRDHTSPLCPLCHSCPLWKENALSYNNLIYTIIASPSIVHYGDGWQDLSINTLPPSITYLYYQWMTFILVCLVGLQNNQIARRLAFNLLVLVQTCTIGEWGLFLSVSGVCELGGKKNITKVVGLLVYYGYISS